jgi:hypothetical protein
MEALRTFGLACLAALLCLGGLVGAAGICAGCAGGSAGGDATGDSPPVVAASFDCGPALTCNAATQYCSVQRGGPAGTPPGHACVSVSGTSARPTCNNISVGIGCECAPSGEGVTVTCTAP